MQISRLLLLCVPLALTGCTSVIDPFLETGAISPDAPPLASSVSPDYALASVPGLTGAVTSVRQTLGDGEVEQIIVFANATSLPGENSVTVLAGRPTGKGRLINAPSRRTVEREMRAAIPGVAMTISPVIGDNMHGVFGYATGELANGGSCLYAWQLAKSLTPKSGGVFTDFGRTNYAADVRLRYCHPGVSAERIVALMKGLRLKPVNGQTMEALAFAAGSGTVALPDIAAADLLIENAPELPAIGYVEQKPAPVVVTAPEPEPEPEPVVETRREKRVIVTEVPKDEREKVIVNAVKVPLPGEAAQLAAAAEAEKQVGPVRPADGKVAGKVLLPTTTPATGTLASAGTAN